MRTGVGQVVAGESADLPVDRGSCGKASLESDRHDPRYTLRCARHAATRRRVRTGRRARTVLVCRGLIANKGEDIRQHGQAPAFGYGEGLHQVTMTGLWEV